MSNWGDAMFVTPGVIVDGKLVTHDLTKINLGIRILLGHSFYDDWANAETFVKTDPLGNPVDQRHPWNQTTIPRPQKRDFDGPYSWTMNPVSVLRLARSLGGELNPVVVVGCEPATLGPEEGLIGLSAPVAAAVDDAVALVESLIARFLASHR